VGAAVHEGLITSLDDPIGRYLPALGHCAYAAVTIRQLLTMTSGILWNENYADPQSDVNEYSRCLAQRRRGGVMDLVRGLPAQYPPGTRWQYNTGNSYLMGAVLAAAVGGHLADYLSTRLWQPAGMEFDAYYTLDAEDGLEIAGSRAGMALRDIGRVAKFVLDDGVIGTRRMLPEGFVEQALSPSHLFTARDREFGQIVAARLSGYGYSWWMQEGGGAVALGHAGQRIFIDRRQSLAVITLSAFPQLPHVPAPLPDREGEVVRFTEAVRDALR
jgi:CubicO group peptidase (beta-lactamase class C family)